MNSLTQRNTILNLIYSAPLLLWFLSSLYFSGWSHASLSPLFQALLPALVFCQLGSMLLTLLDADRASVAEILAASFQALFYPAPLLVLIWLGEEASLRQIILAEFSVIFVALVTLLIIFSTRAFSPMITRALLFVELILLWNLRHFWLPWMGL